MAGFIFVELVPISIYFPFMLQIIVSIIVATMEFVFRLFYSGTISHDNLSHFSMFMENLSIICIKEQKQRKKIK